MSFIFTNKTQQNILGNNVCDGGRSKLLYGS